MEGTTSTPRTQRPKKTTNKTAKDKAQAKKKQFDVVQPKIEPNIKTEPEPISIKMEPGTITTTPTTIPNISNNDINFRQSPSIFTAGLSASAPPQSPITPFYPGMTVSPADLRLAKPDPQPPVIFATSPTPATLARVKLEAYPEDTLMEDIAVKKEVNVGFN